MDRPIQSCNDVDARVVNASRQVEGAAPIGIYTPSLRGKMLYSPLPFLGLFDKRK